MFTVELFGEFDVVIVGGGTSGVAAAISAARAGAKTLLVERTGCLGGQMTLSGPPGFHYCHFFNARWERIVGGIAYEMYERLLQEGHALPHMKTDFRAGYSFSYVDADWWGLLAFKMMQENNVNLLLHSLAVDVIKKDNDVKGVIVENTSGRQLILSKITIDCTGEGDIAARSGASYEKVAKEELQPHTLSFTVDGVDWHEVLHYIKEHPENFEINFLVHPYLKLTREDLLKRIKSIEDITELGGIEGFFSERDEALAKGEWHGLSGVGFFLIPREGGIIQAHFQHSSHVPNCDCTDVRDLTYAEIEARRQIMIAWNFIKKYLPGFKKAYITRICTELRIRESRRIIGDYILTREDVAEARKFPDVIGKSCMPAGGHHLAGLETVVDVSKKWYPKDGGSYDIPYRCLVPRNVENLLVAGKAVSTDRDAYLRYLPQTMVTGQAAGVAGAVCAKKGITPRQLEENVCELQKILEEQGVILRDTH